MFSCKDYDAIANEHVDEFQTMLISNNIESYRKKMQEDIGNAAYKPNSRDFVLTIAIPKSAHSSMFTILYTMDDIRAYRRNLQECIDDETLKYIKSFEFYCDKDDKPHISLSIIDCSEKSEVVMSQIEDDKKRVKDMLCDFGMTEEDILIDFELSSDDFYPAMETEQDDDKATDDDTSNVAAILTCNLGDTGKCNLGPGNEGSCSRGLMIKLQVDKFKGIEKIIPDLDITKEIYANVGASHTVPRIMNLGPQSVVAQELNVTGQSFKVRNKHIHLYNDLEIFIIRNKTKSGLPIQFQALNSFDMTFTHWRSSILYRKNLKGYITDVWSGDVNNKVLKIDDVVYFIGRHNKSYGTVTGFPSISVGNVEHHMIKCKLKVQKGDSGGLLFKVKPIQASHDKVECIAVGICSYFQGDGKVSYFVPLTDLDKSIYMLPLPY